MKAELEKIERDLKAISDKVEALKKQESPNGWYREKNGCICKKGGPGINFFGDWIEDQDWTEHNFYGQWVPATDSEVQSALEKEAVRRGLVEGVKIKSVYSSKILDEKNKVTYEYRSNDDTLVMWGYQNDGDYCGLIIYDKGKWASVVSKPLTLAGHEVEVLDYCVNVKISNTVTKCFSKQMVELFSKATQEEFKNILNNWK